MPIRSAPSLLLVGGNHINCIDGLITALADDSWRVVADPDMAAALQEKPSLVLCAAAADVARVRAANGFGRAVAILAFARDVEDADGYLDPAWPTGRLVGQVAGWRPDGIAATLARLETAFGRAEIHALLVRLRHALRDALATLDRARPLEQAHRLAGLAGTLGFTALAAAWSAISEGRPLEEAALDRLTRVAISAIDTALELDSATADTASAPDGVG